MFEPLIESPRGMKRRAGGTVLSMLVHAMVVAGAVHATERVVKGVGERRTDTVTFVVAPVSKMDETAGDWEAPIPAAPLDAAEMIPADMPTVDIPAIEMNSSSFDAAAVVGRQVSSSVSGLAETGSPETGAARAYMSGEVDDPAIALLQPAPRYPVELERAGVHGFVELEYVIDATGHAEPGSVRVISASHAAFVAGAREAILAGVYRPARYRGSVVRQQVRQRVVFGEY